jgi:hypothetical protein
LLGNGSEQHNFERYMPIDIDRHSTAEQEIDEKVERKEGKSYLEKRLPFIVHQCCPKVDRFIDEDPFGM